MRPAGAAVHSKREQRGWYFYDWANSAFPTSVVTLFFGLHLTGLSRAVAGPDGYVHLLGLRLAPEAVWSYLISLSVLTQVIALPLLGAIADYGRKKRQLLGVTAYTGAIATMLMFFLQGSNYLLGCALFLVANLPSAAPS